MPSPFPGMNPWLEQDFVWPDFHTRYLPRIAGQLARHVGKTYFVKIEQQLYIHERSVDERDLLGIGDVGIAEAHRAPSSPAGGGAQTMTAPVYSIIPPEPERTRHAWIEIRDKRDHAVITVIELLSPSNKRWGPDRDAYFAKRYQLLGSQTHLVEIDLLRGNRRMPLNGLPDCDYYAMVSHVDDRPTVGVWPVALRNRLPVIPVPLRGDDPPINVDLQLALHDVYDESTYENYIYEGEPQPPLLGEDKEWAAQFVPKTAR
jgi:hypothetical protein